MKFNQKYLVGVIAGSLLSSSAFALTCDKSYGMQVTVGATVGVPSVIRRQRRLLIT